MAYMGRVYLALALAAQVTSEPIPDLKEEYLRTKTGSAHALVTVVATHVDGTPLRGHIQCDGWWFKYEDDPERIFSGVSLPFKTDARGAAIFNPRIDDEYIRCWAQDRGMYGEVRVELHGAHVVQMVLNREVKEE